jgi:REP element-mobilizing transposase RayT
MVAGYHLIWTVYGFWLPNDPRGSTSTEVRVVPIADLGEHHYGRKEEQPTSKHIRQFLNDAKEVLAHSVMTLDDVDVAIVGKTLGEQISERDYVCYACAIMPDHVHILIRRNSDRAEDITARFQEATRKTLIDAGKRLPTHPVWTKGPGWKTFINTQRQFQNEIRYIENNPKKIGKPEQKWDFVQEYDGWLP